MSQRSGFFQLVIITLAGCLFAGSALAHSPHPDAKKKFIEEGVWEQKLANLRAFDSVNAEKIAEYGTNDKDRFAAKMALGIEAVDTIRVCVILVDFPDFHYYDTQYPIPAEAGGGTLNANGVVQPQQFDSLLFSREGVDPVYNPTGSMTDFYMENSYGQYFIQGDVHGWYTAPSNYSYYVGLNDGLGPDGHSDELVIAAVQAAEDDGVDFSVYANGGLSVPGVIIVHAGPGAEQGAYGIWSHRSAAAIPPFDGVSMGNYTMNPEENYYSGEITHMGVFCHEWGHVLGLPDWYDANYGEEGSEGLGAWAVMAGGSWNDGGRRPAHFCGWSKFITGFAQPVILENNLKDVAIPAAEYNPAVYILYQYPEPDAQTPGERWIVENRQRYGFDEALPGSGLLIYHFDPAVINNTNPNRYRLALEQADGLNQLAFGANNDGDGGDPFPGSWNNREFHDYSNPSARSNTGELTQVGVWDISDSDSIMYADLDVYYSRPWVVLVGDSLELTDDPAQGAVGDNDGLFEQGETIAAYIHVQNKMKLSFLPIAHLSVDNQDVNIITGDELIGSALNPTMLDMSNPNPMLFSIPEDFRSQRVNISVSVTSVNATSNPTETFETSFSFPVSLGKPQILLVDDDSGNPNNEEWRYTLVLNRMGLPFVRWDKDAVGSPTYEDLSPYPQVFWMTGIYYPYPGYEGGALNADDITALSAYLDDGGNLLFGSISAAEKLHDTDSTFLANYLHANYLGTVAGWYYNGVDGNVIGDGLKSVTLSGLLWQEATNIIAPANGGLPAFTLTNPNGTEDNGYCGVTYAGDYRTVFLTFNVEWQDDARVAQGFAPRDTLIQRALDFFYQGTATAVGDDTPVDLLPEDFVLEQNYPNPFNPSTSISYTLGPGQTRTELAVFNVLGQKVTTLVDQVQGPGSYTVTWNGTTDNGAGVASGIYFYRLKRGDVVDSRKMVFLK